MYFVFRGKEAIKTIWLTFETIWTSTNILMCFVFRGKEAVMTIRPTLETIRTCTDVSL